MAISDAQRNNLARRAQRSFDQAKIERRRRAMQRVGAIKTTRGSRNKITKINTITYVGYKGQEWTTTFGDRPTGPSDAGPQGREAREAVKAKTQAARISEIERVSGRKKGVHKPTQTKQKFNTAAERFKNKDIVRSGGKRVEFEVNGTTRAVTNKELRSVTTPAAAPSQLSSQLAADVRGNLASKPIQQTTSTAPKPISILGEKPLQLDPTIAAQTRARLAAKKIQQTDSSVAPAPSLLDVFPKKKNATIETRQSGRPQSLTDVIREEVATTKGFFQKSNTALKGVSTLAAQAESTGRKSAPILIAAATAVNVPRSIAETTIKKGPVAAAGQVLAGTILFALNPVGSLTSKTPAGKIGELVGISAGGGILRGGAVGSGAVLRKVTGKPKVIGKTSTGAKVIEGQFKDAKVTNARNAPRTSSRNQIIKDATFTEVKYYSGITRTGLPPAKVVSRGGGVSRAQAAGAAAVVVASILFPSNKKGSLLLGKKSKKRTSKAELRKKSAGIARDHRVTRDQGKLIERSGAFEKTITEIVRERSTKKVKDTFLGKDPKTGKHTKVLATAQVDVPFTKATQIVTTTIKQKRLGIGKPTRVTQKIEHLGRSGVPTFKEGKGIVTIGPAKTLKATRRPASQVSRKTTLAQDGPASILQSRLKKTELIPVKKGARKPKDRQPLLIAQGAQSPQPILISAIRKGEIIPKFQQKQVIRQAGGFRKGQKEILINKIREKQRARQAAKDKAASKKTDVVQRQPTDFLPRKKEKPTFDVNAEASVTPAVDITGTATKTALGFNQLTFRGQGFVPAVRGATNIRTISTPFTGQGRISGPKISTRISSGLTSRSAITLTNTALGTTAGTAAAFLIAAGTIQGTSPISIQQSNLGISTAQQPATDLTSALDTSQKQDTQLTQDQTAPQDTAFSGGGGGSTPRDPILGSPPRPPPPRGGGRPGKITRRGRPIIETPKKPPTTKIKLGQSIQSDEKKFGPLFSDKVPGYDSYIREKGKNIKANTTPKTKAEAINTVLDHVDKYTSRSGYIEKRGTVRRTETRVNAAKFAKFNLAKNNTNRFIEKPSFSIDSRQEKQGIPFKAARLRRAGLFNKPSTNSNKKGSLFSKNKVSARGFL